ncbi:KTSC domain-containing protein [Macrococcoides caseolyticum]|uniref:KTSC domain-containing protein n=1 Tax=Macrococcoides caseolyticum TaxID=69966 RepID=UPI00339D66BE
MHRQYVSSSRIDSVGWENDTLEVEFKDGAVYQYHNVPRNVYENFLMSASLGSELSRLDKIYSYTRVG